MHVFLIGLAYGTALGLVVGPVAHLLLRENVIETGIIAWLIAFWMSMIGWLGFRDLAVQGMVGDPCVMPLVAALVSSLATAVVERITRDQ